MQTSFIESIATTGFSKEFEPRFEQGRFTLVNRSVAKANQGGHEYATNLELSTNFQIAGMKPTARAGLPETDLSGINKKYIDDSGVYNMNLALDEFTRKAPGMRMTRIEAEAFAKSSITTDSHEAFIYNMLVSWIKALIYNDTSGKEGKFHVKQSAYSDSHVTVGVKGQVSDVLHEIELGPPVQDYNSETPFVMRNSTNYWLSPYVIRISNKSVKQAAFYYSHTFGRDGDSPLNVDIPIPGLDMHQTLIEPTAGSLPAIVDFEEVPWDRPDIIWTWIKDYVSLNRVEGAFASAFETLASVHSQPMPSYQESAHWHKSKQNLTLAPFTPTRARIPGNLEGEPYSEDLNARDFILDDTSSPRKYLMTSAVATYMSWMGLYAIVDNYSRECVDWRTAFITGDEEMGVLTQLHARAALISIIVGKDVTTCMTQNCHISYDISAMADQDEVIFDIVHEELYPMSVKLEGPVPYVSGSLLLGAVSCDVLAMRHLHSIIEAESDDRGTMSVQDGMNLVHIYRLFGHEVELQHSRSGEVYKLFSSYKECVVSPSLLLDRTRDFDMVTAASQIVRDGRNSDLPPVEVFRRGEKISMVVGKPNLVLVHYGSRQRPVRPTAMLKKRRQEIKFKVKTNVVIEKVTMRSNTHGAARQSGFYTDTIEPAPTRPSHAAVVAVTQVVPDLEENEPVEGAE
ncbi:putative coat protein [Plasmopara viticola lesion associated toti 3]|uniref:Putative coat protein n=1 Tax=Plasmopara viticola lesion associated toti 3 TaxID=2689134 RepID=A0A6B9HD34_9VIRU|nr:putative coat protein [Plasmopara viticola lesion associated toti 3]